MKTLKHNGADWLPKARYGMLASEDYTLVNKKETENLMQQQELTYEVVIAEKAHLFNSHLSHFFYKHYAY